MVDSFGVILWKLVVTRVSLTVKNIKKLIVFEGFKPKGLKIRNQRHFLHNVACVEINFGVFR